VDTAIETIGVEEYLPWKGVTAVEWADKIVFKDWSLWVEFVDAGENRRKLIMKTNPDNAGLLQGI
jgi:tRNA A37 threonylcarbamoyladenosine biosynthesis protein TsaE